MELLGVHNYLSGDVCAGLWRDGERLYYINWWTENLYAYALESGHGWDMRDSWASDLLRKANLPGRYRIINRWESSSPPSWEEIVADPVAYLMRLSL